MTAFPTGRAWIELDRAALAHNVSALRARLGADCALMPAVKANAYGHGAVLIARELNRLGVRAFCVASAAEGAQLREHGVEGEILVLGYTHPADFPLLWRCQLSQTVVDSDHASLLERCGHPIHVHLAIDTGMHRLGARAEDLDAILALFRRKNLLIDGIFTHLSADESLAPPDRAFTLHQAQTFRAVLDALRRNGIPRPKVHLQASYGVLNYPDLAGDYARVGIALYGVLSTAADTEQWRGLLRPVLRLKARVASVRPLYTGETAGYGLQFTAARPMRIAALAIGYADGLPRALSNGRGAVLLHGRRAPILGRICMDQTLIDVSNIPDVRAGDIAVLIGRSGALEISACDWAEQTSSITNEVLSRLGPRLERVFCPPAALGASPSKAISLLTPDFPR